MEGLVLSHTCQSDEHAMSLCAFLPRLFKHTGDVLLEIQEAPANEIIVHREDKDFTILRSQNLILVIITHRKGLAEEDRKILRNVLMELAKVNVPKLEV
jgi:hypothetical protein